MTQNTALDFDLESVYICIITEAVGKVQIGLLASEDGVEFL